jgi:hypothetical protein
MAIDGLWTVVFARSEEDRADIIVSEESSAGGVLVLTGGRVYGGGISYYYVGEFNLNDNLIEMSITAVRYNEFVAGLLGDVDMARLSFEGIVSDDAMKLDGYLEDDPDRHLTIVAEQRHQFQ